MDLRGTRVIRGPDWPREDNSDGGEGWTGTVTEVCGEDRVRVLWDTGQETTQCTGNASRLELRILDTAQIGVCHPGSRCEACGISEVWGLVWSCVTCLTGRQHQLCSFCYHNDRHDTTHIFCCIYNPQATRKLCPRREASVKVRTKGISLGAKVSRGKDWIWANQDGGQGSVGEVKGYECAPTSRRSLAYVQWRKGGANSYRLGYDGKVDVICVEEGAEAWCYIHHLPLLDTRNTSSMLAQTNVHMTTTQPERQKSQQRVFQTQASMNKKCMEATIRHCPKSVANRDTGATSSTATKSTTTTTATKTTKPFAALAVAEKLTLEDRATKDDGEDIEELLKQLGSLTPGTLKNTFLWAADKDEEQNKRADFNVPRLTNSSADCKRANDNQVATSKALQRGSSWSQGSIMSDRHNAYHEQDRTWLKQNFKGLTELQRAVTSGNSRRVQTLLEMGADVNETGRDDVTETPLLLAVKEDRTQIVDMLLLWGADVFRCDSQGRTLAHLAVARNSNLVLRSLVNYGAIINIKDDQENTALHQAVAMNNVLLVDILVKAPQTDINITNSKDYTAIQLACDNPSVLEKLLDRDISHVDHISKHDGLSALHLATVKNNMECVHLLVIKGNADINIKKGTSKEFTPLMVACLAARLEIVQALLGFGADVNMTEETGYTALHMAMGGETRVDVNGKDGDKNMELARRLHISMLLINNGADAHAKNDKGETPLDYGSCSLKTVVKDFLGDHTKESVKKKKKTRRSDRSADDKKAGSEEEEKEEKGFVCTVM